MHISFAVFADGANLSQEGKLNVLGVFDALQVGGFPALHPRTHFVVRLKGSVEDTGPHTLTFNWVNPGGEMLWSSDGELNVAPGPNPAFEMDLPIIAVIDLPLNLPGLYTMQVALDGNPTAEVRLFVSGAPQVVMPANSMVS
ncbi:MAG: hypothetical protein H0U59_12505 [Gemmatimonadaceae bacterium]|nr:hypothetical protein [Gemmatimonadaceae bacterium]MDQ3243062.1 hypothetical protein [Gemmatimonadota bacterium]